jgi:N-acetyl-alpha-D-muramate 1-phosphate uridylyltransferase
MIETAMVLAAGFGKRMRPLTDTIPKPLVSVGGQPLIAYAFDRLREAGVRRAVVNGHYLADQIETWSAQQATPHTVFSDERDEILDTGGGIARALPLLGDRPFYVMNADCFWLDGATPALRRLAARWDDAKMDCLLLLSPPERTTGFDGRGDFVIDGEGRILRYRGPDEGPSPVYIGGYIVHPRLFAAAPKGSFSMHVLWKKALADGRFFGLIHDGWWLHVGTVPAIAEAETKLKEIARLGMPR